MKTAILAGALGALSILFVTASVAPTEAQSRRGQVTTTGGHCPPGTCAKSGQPFASNIKNCKASNCPGAKKNKR